MADETKISVLIGMLKAEQARVRMLTECIGALKEQVDAIKDYAKSLEILRDSQAKLIAMYKTK